jgi:coenzyme Q-binding protein COQ10
MPAIRARRHVDHSAQEMFGLVADIEHYPEFVPHCERHLVLSRTWTENTEILITEMTIVHGVFRETLRSRDTLDRNTGRILVEALDGPLRRLTTVWTFVPRDDGTCDVGFDLSYDLSSRLVEVLLGGIFDAMFRRFVQAFERRADAIYGSTLGEGHCARMRKTAPAGGRADFIATSGNTKLKVADGLILINTRPCLSDMGSGNVV